MSSRFDENNPGYFQSTNTNMCASPHCSNRLTGDDIANGLIHCSDECASDHRQGSDLVMFDDPFELETEEADEDEFAELDTEEDTL